MKSRQLLATCLLLGTTVLSAGGQSPTPTQVRLAFVGPEGEPAHAGVRQGLDEANLQGRFLGQAYRLQVVSPGAVAVTDFSGYLAVVVAAEPAVLRQVAAEAPEHAVLNVSAGDDALRESCAANLLHVIPSDAMRRDAAAQWQEKDPGARVSALAWHSDFMKFAGRDLNKRFRAAFNTGMDDHAWAGWAAVKMVSDMIARQGPESPATLLGHLKSDLAFDGQKGIDLSFRPNGQLRQPLLLVENGQLVGEAPVRGVAASDTDLDSLGTAECRK